MIDIDDSLVGQLTTLEWFFLPKIGWKVFKQNMLVELECTGLTRCLGKRNKAGLLESLQGECQPQVLH